MLGRLKLRREAGSREAVTPQEAVPVGNAWDFLAGAPVRRPAGAADPVHAPGPGPGEQGARPVEAGGAPAQGVAGDAGVAPVVQALFQAALGRAASDEEVAVHARLAGEHGAPGWVLASVQALCGSPEFVARMRVPVEAATLGAAADADAPPVRHAVSLGTHCYASWLLQDMGLRRCSSPFDWLFSSPEVVTHCLEDDFAALLDRAHHERYSAYRQARHRFYDQGFGTEAAPMADPPLFWHHDPMIDEDHARLVRVVERFRRLLDSPDEKLFLLVVARNRPQAALPGTMEALVSAVEARTRNASVLAVAHASLGDQARAHSVPIWGQGRHGLHALHSSSEMVEGLSFAHQFDNLLIKRLVYRHRFDIQPPP